DVDLLALDLAFQRTLAVDRLAQRVDHAAQQGRADRHFHDLAQALDLVAFLDAAVVAEDHDADIVALQVQGHALGAVGELHHFAGHDVVQAIDPGDAVADRQDLADIADLGLIAEAGDLLLEDR